MPSLLHGSWKLLGELFGTGTHDPDALDVVIARYEIIGLPIGIGDQLSISAVDFLLVDGTGNPW